jgi:hypothetical protein
MQAAVARVIEQTLNTPITNVEHLPRRPRPAVVADVPEPPMSVCAIITVSEHIGMQDIQRFTAAAGHLGATKLVIDVWSREADGLVELRYYRPAH